MRTKVIAATIVTVLLGLLMLQWASMDRERRSDAIERTSLPDAGSATPTAPMDTPELAGSREPTGASASAPSGTRPATRPADATQGHGGIQVLSAERIPLEHIQWNAAGEDWTEVSSGDRIPRRARVVRAAGHPRCDVPQSADTVELPADALLRLTCAGLGEAALDPVLDGRFGPPDAERAAALYLGSSSPDELVLAVDIERWSRAWAVGEVHSRVSLRAGGALFVDWQARPGERRTTALALDPAWLAATASTLAIQETSAPPAPEARRSIELTLQGPNDPRGVYEGERLRVTVQQRWLRWTGLATSGSRAEIDDVPLGEDVLVRWRRSDGWYGRLHHHHDGRAAKIELRAPALVRGRVVDEVGGGLAGIEPSILFPRDGERPRMSIVWNAVHAATTDANGAFEITLPAAVPAASQSPDVPETLPTDGVMSLREGGFDEVQIDVVLRPGGVVELGDILLPATHPHLILRHAEPLPESLHTVGWVDGDRVRWHSIGAVRDTDLPTSSLVMNDDAFESEHPPGAIVLASDGAFIGALLRDGIYESVPSARLAVTLDVTQLTPPPEFLNVEIVWRGIDAQIHGAFADSVRAAHAHVDILVPGAGTSVIWNERTTGSPPIRHEIGVLDSLTTTIRLAR